MQIAQQIPAWWLSRKFAENYINQKIIELSVLQHKTFFRVKMHNSNFMAGQTNFGWAKT